MSNRATHWCYACGRPIRLRGQDIICPNCNDGFIQEISEMGGMLNTYGLIEPAFEERPARRFGMMEAMSSLMRQRMAEMGRDRVFDIHGRQGTGTEHGRQSTAGSTLLFGSNTPAPGSESSNVNVVFRRGRRAGIDRPNFSGFLVRPSLEALFEQLSLQNNRQGPAPAPQPAIDSMPVVKINRRHLNDDPQCPVCKDRFEVGSEAREMPCKHLYHTDCIIPWLVQHNSCPVCRHSLPSQPSSNSTRVPSPYYNEAAGPGVTGADLEPAPRNNDGGNQERHSSFSFLWPFDPSSFNSSFYQYEGNMGEPVYDDPSQMTYSEWHYGT
ncbi:probable E3 ubiquitin-protein ligase RHC1A isoform X2 [Phragmites australis]|nr:probable E3 ubiquitin-protein ligase RHC1A isoform X2 [Phragmites australis]